MFLAFILSRLNRSARFSWSPALNFEDRTIYSTLIPGAQYGVRRAPVLGGRGLGWDAALF